MDRDGDGWVTFDDFKLFLGSADDEEEGYFVEGDEGKQVLSADVISEVNSVFYKSALVFTEFRQADQKEIREQMGADLDPSATFVKLETV